MALLPTKIGNSAVSKMIRLWGWAETVNSKVNGIGDTIRHPS